MLPFAAAVVLYDHYDESDEVAKRTRILLAWVCAISNVTFWLFEFVEIDYIGWTWHDVWNQYFSGWNVNEFL